MADDLSDEVFVMENGIISNENVPLILPHDLEAGGDDVGFGLGDEFFDFAAADANQIIQDDLEGNILWVAEEDHPELPGIGMPENGIHQSMSSTHSSAPSSSIAFEQGEVLGTSTPAFETEPFCYVNPSYQSSASDISELTSSVEIRTETESVSFKDLSKSTPGPSNVNDSSGDDKGSQISGFSESKGTQTLKCDSEAVNIAEASTNTVESFEVVMPNPPNSPTDLGRSLSRSGSASQLLRRYRNRARLRVQQLNNPNIPSSLFMKFGSFLLILVLVLLLAIIACLEGLLPRNSLTVLGILWGLTVIGAIACFVKACWEEQSPSERPAFRSGYGSTGRTRPALSSTA